MGEKRILHCQYGEHYFKAHNCTSNRLKLQSTRKIGCKAHIEVKSFTLYPDYCIESELTSAVSEKQKRKLKEATLNRLRIALSQTDQITRTSVMCFISLPSAEAHHSTHPTGPSIALAQKVHPEVIRKIHELVLSGVSETVEMCRHLKYYVTHCLCTDNQPHPNDRAYFPTATDIRNHIYQAQKTLQLSSIDQENCMMKTNEYSKIYPAAKFFFRPSTESAAKETCIRYAEAKEPCAEVKNSNDSTEVKNSNDSTEVKNSNDSTKVKNSNDSTEVKNSNDSTDVKKHETAKQSILWIHQEEWQQELLSKYGNTISMMDATYKTTKYDLPLFFITVRTNSGYCVVAEFIVQSESQCCIEEALSIIKSWNPNWKPNFFMTDYSEAEISALEALFPSTKIYLCDFHREQAWERWVKNHKHGLTSNEAEILLDHLRAIAWAPSVLPDEDGASPNCKYHKFHAAVKVLKDTNIWKNNSNVREWLNNTWLSIPEVLMIHKYIHICKYCLCLYMRALT